MPPDPTVALLTGCRQWLLDPTSTCDPSYFPGGYEPGTLKFTPQLGQAMAYVDGALGSMADELKEKGLWDSTEFIITAKHGQSPIDPAKLHKIGDSVSPIFADKGIGIGQNTEDDVARRRSSSSSD